MTQSVSFQASTGQKESVNAYINKSTTTLHVVDIVADFAAR